MSRKWHWLVVVALTSSAIGCKLPQVPYDYCAATIGPNGQPTGGFMTRQGSILGGMPGGPVYQSQPTLAPPAAQSDQPPAEEGVPGGASSEEPAGQFNPAM